MPTQNSEKNAVQSALAQTREQHSDKDTDSRLDQFISYMKENWKPILTEMVTVGVTAYLAHDAKQKMTKKN